MSQQSLSQRSAVTTHVLDAVAGVAAEGIEVSLTRSEDDQLLATGCTDADGRVTALGPAELAAGRYRISFEVGAYFTARDQPCFYPQVDITFTFPEAVEGGSPVHVHVPILLSPFAFTTYRGT